MPVKTFVEAFHRGMNAYPECELDQEVVGVLDWTERGGEGEETSQAPVFIFASGLPQPYS